MSNEIYYRLSKKARYIKSSRVTTNQLKLTTGLALVALLVDLLVFIVCAVAGITLWIPAGIFLAGVSSLIWAFVKRNDTNCEYGRLLALLVEYGATSSIDKYDGEWQKIIRKARRLGKTSPELIDVVERTLLAFKEIYKCFAECEECKTLLRDSHPNGADEERIADVVKGRLAVFEAKKGVLIASTEQDILNYFKREAFNSLISKAETSVLDETLDAITGDEEDVPPMEGAGQGRIKTVLSVQRE